MKLLILVLFLALFTPWMLNHEERRAQIPVAIEKPTSSATTTRESPPAPPAQRVMPVASTPKAPLPQPPEPSIPQNVVEDDFAHATEAEILRLTNRERIKAGLSPLAQNAQLRMIAWSHSADMLANDYFSHENESGCGSSCRATNAGFLWQAIGENIYMMSGFDLSSEEAAEKIVTGWMHSPGHRANILGDQYTVAGIGIAHVGDKIYATALYAYPR